MRPSTLLSLALVATAVGLGVWLGGARGTGLIAGALMGTSLSGFGIAVQRRLVASRPSFVLPSLAVAFMAKLAALFAVAGVLVFVPGMRERVDPLTCLLCFAVCAFAVLMLGTIEISSALRGASVCKDGDAKQLESSVA